MFLLSLQYNTELGWFILNPFTVSAFLLRGRVLAIRGLGGGYDWFCVLLLYPMKHDTICPRYATPSVSVLGRFQMFVRDAEMAQLREDLLLLGGGCLFIETRDEMVGLMRSRELLAA